MAKEPTATERIGYLIGRRFPLSYLLKIPPSISLSSSGPPADTRELRVAVEAFSQELGALSPTELLQRWNEEKQKEFEQLRAKAEQEERALFFNQPYASADFNHWSKAEHWTLEEAIALVLGKAPEVVSWDKIKAHHATSPFVTRYARLRDLADRAKFWKKLYDHVLPPIFLKWAEDNEIAVPPDLSESVERLKGKLIDWKKRCEDLQAAYDKLDAGYDRLREMNDKHIADRQSLVEKNSDVIAAANLRIAELEGELDAVKGTPTAPAPAKAQSIIERQNMLKAIFGMALRGYSYNPTDKRSKIVAEIASDLELEGIPLSDDTIRRYLKEARELLSEWQQQAG